MNNKIFTISEFGLIGTDDLVINYNSFKSIKVTKELYQELEEFTKTENGKYVFTFSGNGKYLQAKSYVGTIQTKSGYIVEILPKIYNKDNADNSKRIFLELLKILYKLPSFKQINNANFKNENIPILEIFITMFLQEISKIIKIGFKSNYISNQENLFYLKGKLLINEQLKRNHLHKERFYIEYDEYTKNRAENKILKSTLKYLSNVSKSYENIKLIRQYLEHMHNINYSQNTDVDFKSCKIKNRGMKHYKIALRWSKIFLKKESFSSFSGDTIAFSILFPMEKLFENYVEYWLINNEKNIDEVIIQLSDEIFVLRNNKKLFGVRPDFLLKVNNIIRIVADAKWKIINQNNNFSQSDFYQLFAYKHIYNQEDIKLKLYYPMSEFLQDSIIYEYFDNSEIEIIPIDMNELLN
jgi:5-methylcytosine-specific restriction enzyme subunit McrC